MECSTGFQNFSLDRILSHDDTAGGIDFGIAGMDQDAEEMRHIMQIWHFLLVPGTVLKSDFISPGRNGSLGIDLFPCRYRNGREEYPDRLPEVPSRHLRWYYRKICRRWTGHLWYRSDL